ncbi:Lon protease [Photobacterium phosphoreum]|uniref:Lon protease n=1 Tax=Photobacterium phosphoreum TaxID=659 RepID=A0A2T3PEI9_PHOPO|nr:LON peptidase substrate-binding domain-containing protein [Photobacterium phosphoreum]PSU24081.1 Lon protease [Photobacterium phosphoreum]PSU43660.1 Lon protease [Photobacterium phosphoreum]PSU52736.1 Lon protease [Photobacterium phosphoreum]PSW29367.1 Lon protease [Photobacterium phosphoreum]
MNSIALLPHSKHILPGGRLKLVISRVCDIRMVTEAMAHNHLFALGMIAPNSSPETVTNIPAIATMVTIVDFNTRDDGLLEIMVEGTDKISVSTLTMAYDNLLTAVYEPFHAWPTIAINANSQMLANKLNLLFASLPEINECYHDTNYNNATWVCQRWLEILPIDIKHKQSLIHHPTAETAIHFLLQLLQDHNLINN